MGYMIEKIKLIIAGGRDFSDKVRFYRSMNEYVTELNQQGIEIATVVCGTRWTPGTKPRGADEFGDFWAQENGIPVKYFEADWNRYGRSAGPRRNQEMGDYGDQAIVFWDGESRGSKNMIDIMRRLGKSVKVESFTVMKSKPWAGQRNF